MAYESVVIDSQTLEITQRQALAEGRTIKMYQEVPNKALNIAHLNFSDKTLIVQDMSNLKAYKKLKFDNLASTPSPPTCTGAYCYIIPQARVMLRIDSVTLLASVRASEAEENKPLALDFKAIG